MATSDWSLVKSALCKLAFEVSIQKSGIKYREYIFMNKRDIENVPIYIAEIFVAISHA